MGDYLVQVAVCVNPKSMKDLTYEHEVYADQ